jgi:tRNA nucleotidyltransferase/poly(A) polymerase
MLLNILKFKNKSYFVVCQAVLLFLVQFCCMMVANEIISDVMIRIPPHIFPKNPGAYLVGGSIRDILLGRPPLDFDIAVFDEPDSYAKHIAANISGSLVHIGKSVQPIIRVISKNITVDISTLNGQSIEEDLGQRDFTINAMACELDSGKLIDFSGAQQDLENNIVRMVSSNAFVSDPVRLIRAYRMGACLGFNIEPKTAAAIARHASLIQEIAGERTREELFKLLKTDRSHAFLSQMTQSRLLFYIFPELTDLEKIPSDGNTGGSKFEQILHGYLQLENMLTDPRRFIPQAVQSCRQHGGDPAGALLKCSLLWQEVGKTVISPKAHQKDQDDSGYEYKSAAIAHNICKRLRFSNRQSDYIQSMIQNHTRLKSLFGAYRDKTLSPKAITRFFMDCRDRTPDLTLLAMAGAKGEQDRRSSGGHTFWDFLIHKIPDEYTAFRSKASRPPLLSGHDLIKEFGLSPSPQFKVILTLIEEERLSRDRMTRNDALDWVKKYIQSR